MSENVDGVCPNCGSIRVHEVRQVEITVPAGAVLAAERYCDYCGTLFWVMDGDQDGAVSLRAAAVRELYTSPQDPAEKYD